MIRMCMKRDFLAFLACMALAPAAAYEKREEANVATLTEAIDKIGNGFEAYKAANDEQLAEIKKNGVSRPETEAKLKKIDAELDALADVKKRLETMETRAARPGAGATGNNEKGSPEQIAHRDAFVSWIRDSKSHGKGNDLLEKAKTAAGELERRAAAQGIEVRATDTLTGAAGGFAVPEIIAREITRLSVDISPIRQVARVVSAGSPDYKELVDVGGSTFGWVGETDARTETNTPALAEVAPTFGMAYAYPKASEESLQDVFFNVESWLVDSAAEAIGKGEGVAFVSGNGTKKPTGFLAGPAPVATADASRAFGTLQYTPGGGAAAMPTEPNPFIDMVQSLRARYRAGSVWMANKLTLSALRKYKDTTGQYLWQPGLVSGAPDMFLGYRVIEAEDMPDVAANAFPIAFGDFREGYVIVDLAGMRITRDEITTPGYVKFYVRKRVGGKLKNTQAIKLLKIATT